MDIAEKSDCRSESGIREYRTVLVTKTHDAVIRFNQEGVIPLTLKFAQGNPQMPAHHALLDDAGDNVGKLRVAALVEISPFRQQRTERRRIEIMQFFCNSLCIGPEPLVQETKEGQC